MVSLDLDNTFMLSLFVILLDPSRIDVQRHTDPCALKSREWQPRELQAKNAERNSKCKGNNNDKKPNTNRALLFEKLTIDEKKEEDESLKSHTERKLT